jgi:hypothetical protein
MTFIPLLIIIIDESVSIKYPVHCYIQPNDHIRPFLGYFVLRRNIFALSLRKLMIAKKHHRIPRDHLEQRVECLACLRIQTRFIGGRPMAIGMIDRQEDVETCK